MVRLLRKKNRRKDKNTVEETINCDSNAKTTIAAIARLEAFKDSVEAAIESAETTKLTATDDHGAIPRNDTANWISEDEPAAFARAAKPRRPQRIADKQPPPPPRRSKRQQGILAEPETLS